MADWPSGLSHIWDGRWFKRGRYRYSLFISVSRMWWGQMWVGLFTRRYFLALQKIQMEEKSYFSVKKVVVVELAYWVLLGQNGSINLHTIPNMCHSELLSFQIFVILNNSRLNNLPYPKDEKLTGFASHICEYCFSQFSHFDKIYHFIHTSSKLECFFSKVWITLGSCMWF